MSYASSLTDLEWEITELLLPQKKRTRPDAQKTRDFVDPKWVLWYWFLTGNGKTPNLFL